MNVLWLVPRVHSFIRDELVALAPHVTHLHVLSRDACEPIEGVHAEQIECRGDDASIQAALPAMLAAIGWPTDSLAPAHLEALRSLAGWGHHIRQTIRAHQIELVHSHFAFPHGSAGALSSIGRPLIITLRGTDILTAPQLGYGHTLDPLFRQLLTHALGKAEAVTVASDTSVMAVRTLVGDAVQPVKIPNGVDLTRFRPDPSARALWSARLGCSQDAALLLAAGTLTPRKRMDVAVDALPHVLARGIDAHLVIAGDGPELQALADRADRLGVSRHVHMIGRVEHMDMPSLMSAAELLVHVPEVEGFGNVVLEALACGTPVVATATGLSAEALADGSCGTLVPQGDAGAVADAVVALLADGARRGRCGMEAIRHAAAYPMSRRSEAFLALYRPLVREGGELLLQRAGPPPVPGCGPVVALIGTDEGAQSLSPTATVCRLMPHDADVMPCRWSRCPELLVIQASAGDGEGPWRHLGSMYAPDRASQMQRLIGSAHARGVPVVVWRDAPAWRMCGAMQGIGHVLERPGTSFDPAEVLAAVHSGRAE